MKKDFFHILLERARVGGTRDRKGRTARKDSDLPKKQSMKKAHSDKKSLNENLSPLKKYLRAQVGRPWNKVHSEMCKVLKSDSAVQKHVLDHVKDFIELHVVIEDDGPHYKAGMYWRSNHKLGGDRLYVDPRDGIIKKTKHEPRKKYKQPTPLEEFINIINSHITSEKNPSSKLEIEGDQLFKVFWDDYLEDYDRYNVANKTHANHDFDRILWWNVGVWNTRTLLKAETAAKKLKSQYVDQFYIRLHAKIEYDAQREAQLKKERELKKKQEAEAAKTTK